MWPFNKEDGWLRQTYNPEDDIWVTAEDEPIRVSDMEDSHLLNAERMLREWERDGVYSEPAVSAGVDRLTHELDKRGLRQFPLRASVLWVEQDGFINQTSNPVWCGGVLANARPEDFD